MLSFNEVVQIPHTDDVYSSFFVHKTVFYVKKETTMTSIISNC